MSSKEEIKSEQKKLDDTIIDDYDVMDDHAYEHALGNLTDEQKKYVERLEFSRKIKRVLASRVGYRCSNPNCKVKSTIGPGDGHNDIVLLGEAGHIIGAIQDGEDRLSPRSDSSKKISDIISLDNGIWLCRTCHKLVDSKITTYTIDKLKEWKKLAEDKQSKILEEQPSTFVEDYIYPSIKVDKGISSNDFGTKEWCLIAYIMSFYDKSGEYLSFEQYDGSAFDTEYRSWMSKNAIDTKNSGLNFDDWNEFRNQLRNITNKLTGLVIMDNDGLIYGKEFDNFTEKFFEEDNNALEKLINELSKL
jgi:hypothetical protein